jgi:hypothetical protein
MLCVKHTLHPGSAGHRRPTGSPLPDRRLRRSYPEVMYMPCQSAAATAAGAPEIAERVRKLAGADRGGQEVAA